MTEHEEFVVQPTGSAGWVISACSGHGFKLGSLMGDLVARGITGEMRPSEVTALAAGRVTHPSWRQAIAA